MADYDELTQAQQVRYVGGLARVALGAWGLQGAPVRLVQHFHNTTFRVGEGFALRAARPEYQSDAALRSEATFLEHLAAGGLDCLTPVRTLDGEPLVVSGERRLMLFEWIPGRRMRRSFGRRGARAIGELAGRFHVLSAAFRPPAGFQRRRLDPETLAGEATGFPRELVRSRLSAEELGVIDRATEFARRAWDEIDDTGLVHGDFHLANALWVRGTPHLIDFDDMGWAPFAYDLAVARGECLERESSEELWGLLLDGYASVRPLPAGLETHLDAVVAARHVFVAMWLAGNLDHPSFTGAQRWIDNSLEELRHLTP